ncbi:S41 family peptidase [Capnocytophaga canimorsus]|uniref:S41 family peptidase n=1 Tax=Capnocytophaga canimorsus TaxID=28188 RepID=UPI0037CD5CC5
MKRFFLLGTLAVMLFSCKDDFDDNIKPAEKNDDLIVQDFIWQGLNTYYLWQENVPELADNRFATTLSQTHLGNPKYATFLKNHPDPEKFFYSLLHQYKKIDRFSYIVDDYTELERDFQGISLSSGMNFGLTTYGSSDGVLGFVRYILPNSDAQAQGIERGDIFIGIDEQPLNLNNYRALLFNDKPSMSFEVYRIESQIIENKPVNRIVPTGKVVTLNKTEIKENPIHKHQVITLANGEKVGYLMYNQFVGSDEANQALNNVFGLFKNENIQHFVLDLRYNGGGSVQTATYLASMITGQFSGKVFAKERWNKKLQKAMEERRSTDNLFTDKIVLNNNHSESINGLNLNKIYIITSNGTASASELIINGLKPHIKVIQVGDITVGKNQGSVTLYDIIDKQGTRNPKHKWAMQPLVLKIENSLGQGDYTSGITPDISIEEDLSKMGQLGQSSDPLLKKVLDNITGTGKPQPETPQMPVKPFANSKSFNPIANEMYLEVNPLNTK